MDIFILLAIVFGFSALVAFLFMKMGFSHIAGYLIAGVLLSFTFQESFRDYENFLKFFSDVAITLLVFEIGREVGIEGIKNARFLPAAILVFEIVIAFLIATLVGNLLEMSAIEIFVLATIGSFSSTAVIFKLLNSSKFEGEIGEIILTVMIIEDIYAIIILAILPQLAVGNVHVLEIIRLLFFSVAITATLVFVALTLLHRIFERVIKADELGVSFAISSAFLFATISKIFGLSPALGAFSAGLALSTHPKNVEIGKYIRPIREIFLILFFVSLGLEAGLSKEIPLTLLPIPFLMIFGRFCAYTTSNWILSKRSLEDCIRIGFLATSVGEFGIIITYEAMNLGLVSREFLSISAIAVILGTLSSSKLTSNQRYAEKIASLIPLEIKVFVSSISINVTRIIESKGGEFVRLLIVRIFRNTIAVIAVSMIGSISLYVIDLFVSELKYYFSTLILAVVFAVIITVSVKTKSHAEELCRFLVEKRGVDPTMRRFISGLTFAFIMLTSINLVLLVSGRFIIEIVKDSLMIPLSQSFATIAFLFTFSLSVYFIYIQIRKIPI